LNKMRRFSDFVSDIVFGNDETQTGFFDPIETNLLVTKHVILGLFLRAIVVNFSLNANELNQVFAGNQSQNMLVVNARQMVNLQVETENIGMLLQDNARETCHMLESFKKIHVGTQKLPSFHRIVLIRSQDILLKCHSCIVHTFSQISSKENPVGSGNLVKLTMPPKEVAAYIENMANKSPIYLNSSILQSSLNFSQNFLAITQTSKTTTQFHTSVILTKILLAQNLTPPNDMIPNETLTAFPFENIHDDLAPFVVLLTLNDSEQKVSEIDQYKMTQSLFKRLTAKTVHFLIYKPAESSLGAGWNYDVEEKQLQINRGIVSQLWTLTLSNIDDNFTNISQVLEEDIAKYLSQFNGKLRSLIIDMLAQFSALPALWNVDMLIEKIVSHGQAKNWGKRNYWMFLATTVDGNKALVVNIEKCTKELESGFTLGRFEHSKGFQLSLRVPDSPGKLETEKQTDKSWPIQTFFNLDVFGIPEPGFDAVKLKSSIYACLLDYDKLVEPITLNLLKTAIRALLETSYIDIQRKCSVSIDDNALLFTDEKLTSVITIDFVTTVGQEYIGGSYLKHINIMHNFRMAQKLPEYCNGNINRIHWVILLTKQKSLMVFKRVSPKTGLKDTFEKFSDTNDLKFLSYRNLINTVTNDTVVTEFPMKSYDILQSALSDLLSQKVLSNILNHKLKIHAPTFELVKMLLPLTRTTFPVNHLVQKLFHAANSLYSIPNTSITHAQLNFLSKPRQNNMCVETRRTGIKSTVIKSGTTNRACSADLEPFSKDQFGNLLKERQSTNDIEFFDDFLVELCHKPFDIVVNKILKSIGEQYSDAILYNNFINNNKLSRVSKDRIRKSKKNGVKITTEIWCLSDGVLDLNDRRVSSGVDRSQLSNQQQCLVGHVFSKRDINQINMLFLLNSTVHTSIQTPVLNTSSNYLINTEGHMNILDASEKTVFSLLARNTSGFLSCRHLSKSCTLDLRFYAGKETNQQMLTINSTGDVTEIISPFQNVTLEAQNVRRLIDRRNQSDNILIGRKSSLKFLHLSSKNQNRDRVSIARDFRGGELFLELTGSKTILDRAQQSRFVYAVTEQRKSRMSFVFSSPSSQHSIVFDKCFESVNSVTAVATSSGKLFTEHLSLTLTSSDIVDNKMIITMDKPINTYVNLIFETNTLMLFGKFALLKTTINIAEEIRWYLPNYTIIQSIFDPKGYSVQSAPLSDDNSFQNSSLVLEPAIFHHTKIHLPRHCETHFMFKIHDVNLQRYQKIHIVKDDKTDTNTILNLQEIVAYAHLNMDYCSVELIVSLVELNQKIVHVACVTDNRTLPFFHIVIECPENKMDSFIFLLSPHHPTVITINQVPEDTNPLSMKPMPIYFAAECEFIVLVEDFLVPHTEVVIDKNVDMNDMKFVMVNNWHLLILNENPEVSVMLVDFVENPGSVLRKICLKFNNFLINLADVNI